MNINVSKITKIRARVRVEYPNRLVNDTTIKKVKQKGLGSLKSKFG
jgi:hypothetical protein